MALSGGIELAPLLTKIKVDISGFKTEMEQVKTEAVNQAKKVSDSMTKTAKVGEQMSKVGGALTKTVSLPLVAVGGAATKMAIDFESSFAKVSTLLDKNVVDHDKYKKDILDASSDSKIAVGEFSEAVYQSISAGVDQTKAIGFTTNAMKLAKGGFTDGAKAVDILTTAINAYGLSSDDATKVSDMLITTQNLGKTTVDELASSMGRVIPSAKSYNVNLQNVTTSLAVLTKNGIATAEATTYYNAMLNELGKSGTQADKILREKLGKSFSELQKEGVPLTECLAILKDEAEKSGKSLGDMFGSSEAAKSALTIMKDGGVEYNGILKQMEESAGATQSAFEKIDATPAEKLKGALNELKNAGIKLGTSLIPIITKFADGLSKVVDWFNELTPAQQENIVKLGLLAAAVGPVLKVTGGLITSYTKLKPLISGTSTLFSKSLPIIGNLGTKLATSGGLIGKFGGLLSKLAPAASSVAPALSTVATGATGVGTAAATASGAAGIGGLLSSLGGMAVAAAPWVAGAAVIGAAGYGIYKTLTADVIPAVDLFEDQVTTSYDVVTGKISTTTVKISEETEKQVQSYMDLSNKAQQESMNMYVGITKVTDENVAKITTSVNGMSTQIIGSVNNQRNEVVGKYQDMFANTTAITEEEKAAIMTTVNTGYDERIAKTTALRDELITIYQQISDQAGQITLDQQTRIDQIYLEMKEQAVLAMSQNEAEQNVILNRLNSNTKSITAEMVGDTIKQMNEAKDKQIQTAADKRDALVLQAEQLKTLEGGIYAEGAQKIIDEANREYEGIVTAAEKSRTDGIDKLMTAHSEFADDIDIETGDVISSWQRMFGTWDKWEPKGKYAAVSVATNFTETYEKWKGSHYNGLSYVPFDGYNARLHEGERVLTAKENKEYTNNKALNKGGKTTIEIPLFINDREFAIATKDVFAEELGFIGG